MTDPKLLITLVAGLLCAGWYAWDVGWISGWKLPTFTKPTEPELSAAQAFAAAELLVRYYDKRTCLEGSRAAKAAAAHLLDCPGGAA
jgi:hypothetical protein